MSTTTDPLPKPLVNFPAGEGLVSSDLFAKFRAIVNRLDALSFEVLEDPDCEVLCEAIEDLREWGCEVGEHEWIPDQCGYWQHQYCVHCGEAKYPDMAKQRCGELDAQMGRISEEEFLKANSLDMTAKNANVNTSPD